MTSSPLPLARPAMPAAAACERVPPAHPSHVTHAYCRDESDDNLPLDPRVWGRAEVGAWVSRRGGRPERFPMNGKALCLMNRDMFTARVPRSGALLHQEFRRRLARALALQELIDKLQMAAK